MPDLKKSDLIVRGCLSKNAYETLARAEMEAAKARKKHKRNKDIHAYRCPFTDEFHIGHDKRKTS